MRIAMIGAKGLPGLQPVGGGIETHVENLARLLVLRGHEVTVYVRKYANPRRKKTLDGIKIETLGSWHTKNLDAISHTFFCSLHALGEDYDVVHYHGIGPGTLAWIPRLFKRNAKVITTFHSRDQYHEKWSLPARAYLMFAEYAAIWFPHKTIAVSHNIKRICDKIFSSNKVVYIPNGVEMPTRIPAAKNLIKLGLKPFGYFLHLSRLVPHKAQDLAIKAFKKIDAPDEALVIAGSATFDDEDYLRDLEKLAANDERIKFVGHQSGEDLHALIAYCRALVHPSRSEGLALVILEAMSYGRPVIMSDIPENLELIDHAGISVKKDDLDELSQAMQWVIDDRATADGRGARGQEIIKRLFNWSSIAKRTEELYMENVYEYKMATYKNRKA